MDFVAAEPFTWFAPAAASISAMVVTSGVEGCIARGFEKIAPG